jgi:hypothetical protein
LRNLRKKGYYFVIDALIGSTIIVLSLMVVLSSGVRPTKIQYNYEMAEEYSTFILTTKIQDLANPYINQLILNKQINDTSLTIMEQTDLFYFKGDLTHATGVIQNLTEPLIPEKYSLSYNIIEGSTTTNIYNRSVTDINEARVIISSRKITFLQIDSATMFGPATVEIKIWI